MNQFELTLAWTIWIWIMISSILASYIGNCYIEDMRGHNNSNLDIPNKCTFTNLAKVSNNFTFFVQYRPQVTDSKEFIIAAQRWRVLQVIYYFQLTVLFIIFFEYLPNN